MITTKAKNIDEYIAQFPKNVQEILEEIRETIKKAAPKATEAISYAIPTFKLQNKSLVHFAAFKNHIGFYAAPTGHVAFKEELSAYKTGKGSVQFQLDRPMPFDLIYRITRNNVEENEKKTKK